MPTLLESLCISDLHKDAYGFRPSIDTYAYWKSLSEDALNAEYDKMLVQLEYTMAKEEEDKALAIVAFKAFLATAQQLGLCTATAIRVDMEAHNCGDDIGFYEYHWGVPYGYIKALI